MPQYDAIMRFTDMAEAMADPVVGEHLDEDGHPKRDRGMIVQVWRHSQDVVGTDADGNEIRTHNYLPGYYIWVSANRDIPAIRNHAATQLILDRDKLNNDLPGGIIKRAFSAAILADIRVSPVMMENCQWPWGRAG